MIYCPYLCIVSILTLGRLPNVWGRPAIRFWGRAMLWITGARVKVIGAEHLAGRQPRVITYNHQSTNDLFTICALLPEGGTMVAKREILLVPLIGWVVYSMDFVIVDRKNRERAQRTLARAAQRIHKEKLSAVIAPEGTRTEVQTVGPFKLGAFHMAQDSGAPIVPMIIHGAAKLWPRSRSFSVQDGTILVEFLPPYAVEPSTKEELRIRCDEVRQIFVTSIEERDYDPSQSDLVIEATSS